MKKLKAKKILACLLTGAMVLSLTACGGDAQPAAQEPVQETAAPAEEPAQEAAPEVAAYEYDSTASITFDDGNFAFLGSDSTVNPAAKETLFELTDRNGQKAVKVTSSANGKLYAAVAMDALLGDKVGEVASVELGLESSQGSSFTAVSGNIYFNLAGVQSGSAWSIYLENKNPKTVSAALPGPAAAGDFMVVTLEDSAAGNVEGAELYIYTISFKDASGNVLAVDTSAEYVAKSNDGPDRSNLLSCSDYVTFEGFACTGDAWAQNGFEMPEEVFEALQPGTLIEVEYTSEDGELWVVIPWAEAGWMRVGQNDDYINDSHSVAQVTYEQIAALCGEDKSTWGAMLQCEGSSAWEVYSLKIGTVGAAKEFASAVNFEGFACTGDAWAQNGFEMPQEFVDALVPGSVIKVQYSSEDGDLWIVMPWAEAGWMRVGQAGSGDDAVCDGSTCYVTYEQIEALCGEDKSTWGAMLQCEGSSAWEVYSVEVGTMKASEAKVFVPGVEFEGFACTGDAWAQNGFEMPQEIVDALVPGSVIRLQYTSEDGDLWVVMPWAEAGWMRVGQAGSGDDAICDGSVCYVTYEQIEALCGEDKSTWGAMLQAEGSSAWEVYSVNIGTFGEGAPALRGLKDFEGFACTGDAWAQNGFEMPQEFVDALVPGSVIKVQYTSEDGALWIVMPWAEAGWMRVGQAGSGDDAICDGHYCYVTYEQIEALCGEDKSTWGAMLQCEGSSAWEVYSVQIGQK